MPIAGAAAYLHPSHSMRGVDMVAHSLRFDRRGKAGPACAAVIFFGTIEQFGAATGAEIAAFVFVVIKFASEGALGACFAQHMILLGGQLGFPLGVGENLLFHDTNMGPAGGGITIVYASADRKSVGQGKSGSVRLELG